jgi:citrate synthase
LQSKIQTHLDEKMPIVKKLKKDNTVIHNTTIAQAVGGMRSIKCMVSETSLLDPMEGIRYRGHTLEECNEKLIKAAGGGNVGLPEAAMWLLLTNEFPTQQEVDALNAELHQRAQIPHHVIAMIDNLPRETHPMTQLGMALLALQPGSVFGQKYRDGTMPRDQYWKYTLEDALTLTAQIPIVAARIFRNVYFNGEHINTNTNLDWAGNYADMLGVASGDMTDGFREVTRLYLMLHADHEGGNVSAHTTHLVGSALADPYLSYAAGVCGLAGPLHGLANQECLRWLRNTQASLNGQEPTVELLTQFAKDTLAAGKVIPGFGHGVLRKTDPRYTLQREYFRKLAPNDPLFKLANVCYEAIPPVLEATGKVANPWPNVDALSGTCMQYYGLTQEDYYTVVFAVSRAIGCVSNLVWSRAMGMPIERPKSVTIDWLAASSKE